MLDKEQLFTGYYSAIGEKIYLGDKVRYFFHSGMSGAFAVWYDDLEQNYVLLPIGRDAREAPFRKYPLKGNLDFPQPKYHVTGNTIFSHTPEVGDKVKVIVVNKGEAFPFGCHSEVTAVDHWHITVKSPLTGEEKELQFGEFMEIRPLYAEFVQPLQADE